MMAGDVVLACALDAAIGDPRWFPHPVRGMGLVAIWFEQRVRPLCRSPHSLRCGGIVLALGLPLLSFLVGWLLIELATNVHDWVGRGAAVLLAWTTLAWRDLVDHVGMVVNALKAESLPQAREAVGLIVGRDTETLTEAEVVRATVETIAESASDGIIAPLFYLMVGGAPLALGYKAINTLDSMIGHRDERYRDFGWASARLDDAANWIPARLTAGLMVMAAGLVRGIGSARRSWCILLRDGHKHPSPNSGRPEAAMAGALGVQLGGVNRYDGVPVERPHLGDRLEPLTSLHVVCARTIMTAAYLLAIAGAMSWLWL